MSDHGWYVEYRESSSIDVNAGYWWVTNGIESRRMVSKRVAETIAGLLNRSG